MNPLAGLSAPAKLGQLLMLGFEGGEFSPGLERLLQKYRPGGVILFERNYRNRRQLKQLCRNLQTWALSQSPPLALFIATDHEGGPVQRFRREFTILPPAAEINDPQQAYWLGKVIGRELAAVGLNMNMAPVLDVNSNPQNPIIGKRAFADSPRGVIELTIPFIKGMQEEGIIAVGKHFPGHGDTTLDSHKALPVVSAGEKTLLRRELPPFKAAVLGGRVDVMMTAHVLYPAWDKNDPATTSAFILQKILRQKLGFDGIIISDDLLMGALAGAQIGQTACRALEAGVDILLLCAESETQEQVFDALQDAYQRGRLTEERLQESLARIWKIKQRYLTGNSHVG